MENKIWYTKPAEQWEEALPVGNGSLGAMVYGGCREERILFNKDTLWSGIPACLDNMEQYFKGGREHLAEIRRCILSKDFAGARDLIEAQILGEWGESYLPLCELILETDAGETCANYRRELDLETGIVSISYQAGGVEVKRELFCSSPGGAFILRQTTSKKKDTVVSLKCLMNHQIKEEGNVLWADGVCPSHVEPDYMEDAPEPISYAEEGIRFRAGIQAVSAEGTVLSENGRLYIKGSCSFMLCLTEADSFVSYKEKPVGEYQSACLNKLNEAAFISYEEHREAHVQDHGALFGRVKLVLEESEDSKLPTDERLRAFEKSDTKDMQLMALLFQYGRYLTIAASRAGSQAMNLQGIWSRKLRSVWSCNYTVNINTQMNYWPTLSCNLTELTEPLTRLITETAESGSITARELYGCRGWVSHHNIDLWRKTTPAGGLWNRKGFSAVRHSMWPMSGAWLCRHLFEQYEYTLDEDFLRNQAFPVMKGSAEFMLDWLVEAEDGSLMTVPSTSPENEFCYQGEVFSAAVSSAMDISIIRELFGNCIKAMDIIGAQEGFYESVKAAAERLPKLKKNKDGGIREWEEDFEENEVHHRHVSNLYGLYPGECMEKELEEACENSLIRRGDEGTGWSIAWKTCLWARLKREDRVFALLRRQLKLVEGLSVSYTNGGIYPNLFMAHPPFQIDANLGFTAAVSEALVQCRDGCIEFLPACPKQWGTGSVTGLLAKGNLRVDMDFSSGELTGVRLHALPVTGSKKRHQYELRYRGRQARIWLNPGETVSLLPESFD